MTFPITVESICSPFKPASFKAAWAATVCNWVAEVFLNAPPKVPKAVRLAATTKTPVQQKNISSVNKLHLLKL